jgi:hypothetical protein
MSDDLIAFLNARLDERAARAQAALAEAGEAEWHYDSNGWVRTASDRGPAVAHGAQDFLGPEVGEFVADNDPARALSEIEAKRRVMGEALFIWNSDVDGIFGSGWDILRMLAAVYADHPEYRKEWTP